MKVIADNETVNKHLGLVYACVRYYEGRSVEHDDLVQAGCLGLLKAIKRYDEAKGFAFSTYAYPLINGEIQRLFRDGRTMRIPRAIQNLATKITKEPDGLSTEELAERLQQPPKKIAEAQKALIPISSLSYSTDDGTKNSEWDIAEDSKEDSILDHIDLESALNKLNGYDRKLIELRYYQSKSQVETAKIMQINQVSVSRREQKILKKLREAL